MRRINRWATRTTAIIGVGVVAMTAFSPAVAAAAGDRSAAEARFLSGSAAGNDFDQVAALEGADAKRSGKTKSDKAANALAGSVLGQALPEQPAGLNIPLDGLVTLGAANQYAEARSRAEARAASGAVADSGAINTRASQDFPANVEFSLTDLLTDNNAPKELADQIKLDLDLGAISSTAELDATKDRRLATRCADLSNPQQCRDYNIADAKLTLGVPALGDLLKTLNIGLAETDASAPCSTLPADAPAPVDDLCGMLEQVTGASPVKIKANGPDVQKILSSVADPKGTSGVGIDLAEGEVVLDIAKIVEKATGKGLNELPPNTEIVQYVAKALAENLPKVLPQMIDELTTALQKELTTSGLTITGEGQTPIVLNGAEVEPYLDQISAPVKKAVVDGGTQLATQLEPLNEQLGALQDLIGLYVNVQDEPSEGVYRVTALKVQILKAAGGTPLALPGGGTSVEAADPEAGIVLNLARSQVSASVGKEPSEVGTTTPVKNGPNLPNTGASTMDLPLLLLGLGLVSAGMWIIMYGRSESLES